MRIISSAWAPGTLAEFEANITLNVHAALGYGADGTRLTIYVLAGYDKFPADYIARHAAAGIDLVDAQEPAARYLAAYAGLIPAEDLRLGRLYELYCYIRWLVVAEMAPTGAFLHMDLDLFFNLPLGEVAKVFKGATGTFNSPCLTAVSDRTWLDIYRAALDRMLVDPEGLRAELTYKGHARRAVIGSDQDLLGALAAVARLPRQGIKEIGQAYAVFPNPLQPHYPKRPDTPMTFEQRDGVDHIDGKRVLFWHLQNDAADYFGRYALIEQNWLPHLQACRLELPIFVLRPTAENIAFASMKAMAQPRISAHLSQGGAIGDLTLERCFARAWIADWFILQKGGRGLFSSRFWHEEGIFV